MRLAANLLIWLGAWLLVLSLSAAEPVSSPTLDLAPADFAPTQAVPARTAAPRAATPIPPPLAPTAAGAPLAVLPESALPGDQGPESEAPDPQPPTASPQPLVLVRPNESAPTRLVIPAIQLDAPVQPIGLAQAMQDGQAVSQWQVPDGRVVGWHNTSVAPGQPGNTVLNGHHNINGQVFRYLVNLKPGDAIELYAGDQVYHYVVSERQILPEKGQPLAVRLKNAEWIQPTTDERLTLVTCWPYTNNTHRLVVVARPAETQQQ
jgi:sortase A